MMNWCQLFLWWVCIYYLHKNNLLRRAVGVCITQTIRGLLRPDRHNVVKEEMGIATTYGAVERGPVQNKLKVKESSPKWMNGNK